MKGTLYALMKVIYHFLQNRWIVHELRKSNTIGHHVYITPGSEIGKGCKIGDHVIIGDKVILRDGVVIGSGARLERITLDEDTVFESRALSTGYGQGCIEVGRDSYIGLGVVLDFSENVRIGDFVHIAGPSTGLWTHSSAQMCLNSISIREKSIVYRPVAPINIESNVYIGGNCTIYPGIKIGHHSIVVPNSAVVHDVQPYSMVGGVPARFIKSTTNLAGQ